MIELLNPLFTLLINYGYPILFVCILFPYVGIPIPSDAFILAAGSFTVDGTLKLVVLIPLVAVTAISADLAGYFLGRKFKHILVYSVAAKIGITPVMLTSVEHFLNRWGVWTVFFTRWLITPLGIPVNLIAGISNYSLRKFFIFVAIGELVWACVYLYLGYLFGANWQALWEYISNAPQILALLLVGIGLLYTAMRVGKKYIIK